MNTRQVVEKHVLNKCMHCAWARLIIHIYIPTYIRLFKAFKSKDKYVQKMPRKGSLRDWPYVKNSLKKNLKNIV